MSKEVNYLAECYGKCILKKGMLSVKKNGRSIIYSINGKKYIDPDANSKGLYIEWCNFLTRKEPKWEIELEQGGLSLKVKVNENVYILTSDYIGPSKYWTARSLFMEGDTEEDINCKMTYILAETRKFKGHMVWPKGIYTDGKYISLGNNSINMSRGGASGLYDRFDLTLLLLSVYYKLFIESDDYKAKSLMNREKVFEDRLKDFWDIEKDCTRIFRMFIAFEVSKEWLKLFNNFNGFINEFNLESFMKDDEVLISGGKSIKILPTDFSYANECRNLISQRDVDK